MSAIRIRQLATGLSPLLLTGATYAQGAGEETPPGVSDFLFAPHYLLFMVRAAVGMILVWRRGVNRWVRLGAMATVFVLFGLDYFFPMHPSPMCGMTKLFMFKITTGVFFPIFVALFLAMFIPSLFGRKLFCGWVCPLGAFQELINKIPHKFHIKRFNFTVFNAIRMGLLVMFFVTFFFVKDHITLLGERLETDTTANLWTAFKAYSIYDPINAFELLHWNISTSFFVLMGILVIASFLLYRPLLFGLSDRGADLAAGKGCAGTGPGRSLRLHAVYGVCRGRPLPDN